MNYPYLNDKAFLKLFDNEKHKIQYVRITVLDFTTEVAIASIEGKCTSGSCNLSGTSNMRRTASCSLVVDPDGIVQSDGTIVEDYYNITEVQNLISLNKKVIIETGFQNTLAAAGYYNSYNKIWFPLGMYVIKAANVSKNNSGINISLTLNDKTALINGDMGGTIPAATVFSETELFDGSNGSSRTVVNSLIKDIIRSLVVDFGGENPENVLISDIPDNIVKVMKWSGKEPLYFVTTGGKKHFTLEEPTDESYETYQYGQDIGYMNEPFVYPGTLECAAGESVASVLDKIKNTLGNFEWFYDINGKFIFREKRNNLNSNTVDDFLNLKEQEYLSYTNQTGVVYTFDNPQQITSISSNPQFQNIKNDFVVWGKSKTSTGNDKPIRYHLAFAKKPDLTESTRPAILYTDYRGLRVPCILNSENHVIGEVPGVGADKNKFYIAKPDSGNSLQPAIYSWDDEYNGFRIFEDYELVQLKTTNWRTELYYRGLETGEKTFAKNYYAAELNYEWPKLVNFQGRFVATGSYGGFHAHIWQDTYKTDLDKASYEFWLDFLEGSEGGSEAISQFSVNNIGRRTKVVSEDSCNCIFPTKVPNYVLIEADGDVTEDIAIAIEKGQEVIQVSSDIFKDISLGGRQSSAFDKVKDLIFTHTQYSESVALAVIPIYYLEPQSLISIFDNETGVYGEYLIQTISLPLTPNGTSNISATKALSKII